MTKCQDEHDGHFTGELHPYGKEFPDAHILVVKTPFSTFNVCSDCLLRLTAVGLVESVSALPAMSAGK
jgi:hypothetical protein